MHRSLIVLPALLSAPLAACVVGGSGATYVDSQRHTYANFEQVDVSAGIEVVVGQGPFDVKAEATEGGFDNLIVEVKGDTLHISRKAQILDYNGPRYRVTVSAPTYRGFEASSGSSLNATNLTLTDVRARASSGASMSLSGACTTLTLDISSGASFDGEGLKCDAATVDASSGASARAFAAKSADGEASSGATVSFYGQPAQFREDTSSGGSVRAR
jgi:hypothetical protein